MNDKHHTGGTVLPERRIRCLARNYGQTRADGSQARAAALYLTDTPDEFLQAASAALAVPGTNLREMLPGDPFELVVERSRRRFWFGYRGDESWSDVYNPHRMLTGWHQEHQWAREDPIAEQAWRKLAHGRQFLLWNEQWGIDVSLEIARGVRNLRL